MGDNTAIDVQMKGLNAEEGQETPNTEARKRKNGSRTGGSNLRLWKRMAQAKNVGGQEGG